MLLLAVTSALYGLKVALILNNIANFILGLTRTKSFIKIKQTEYMKVEMILTIKYRGFILTCRCATQTSK